MWEDKKLGQLISLNALAECEQLRKPQALLPSWNEIRSNYPELICHHPEPYHESYFVSHRWDGLEHPDPTGWQLRALIEWGRQARASGTSKVVNIWLDYMSLPQKPRDADEDAIFRTGLGNIRRVISLLWHATLVSKSGSSEQEDIIALHKRGWIIFELLIAKNHTKSSRMIFERYGARQFYTDDYLMTEYVKDLNELICTDNTELIHSWFEKNDIRCTNGSDLLYLCSLLHEESIKIDYKILPSGVEFNVEKHISNEEMMKYAINKFTDLSPRFRNIYLKNCKFHASKGDKDASWDVLFVYRPPVPEIDVWVMMQILPINEMMIDPSTGRSKMYPGIHFEFDLKNKMVKATVL